MILFLFKRPARATFFQRKGQGVIPPISSGLLAGTFRWFRFGKGDVAVRVLSFEDVFDAEAAYVGNSIRCLVLAAVMDC